MFTVRSVISSPLRSPLRAALRHPTLSKGVGVPQWKLARRLAPSVAVPGSGTIYVSGTSPSVLPAGNDTTGDGSIGAPYATLTKAMAVLATSGDKLVLCDGTFSESTASGGRWILNKLFTAPVVFDSYSGDPANFIITNASGTSGVINVRSAQCGKIQIRRATIRSSTDSNYLFRSNPDTSGHVGSDIRFFDCVWEARTQSINTLSAIDLSTDFGITALYFVRCLFKKVAGGSTTYLPQLLNSQPTTSTTATQPHSDVGFWDCSTTDANWLGFSSSMVAGVAKFTAVRCSFSVTGNHSFLLGRDTSNDTTPKVTNVYVQGCTMTASGSNPHGALIGSNMQASGDPTITNNAMTDGVVFEGNTVNTGLQGIVTKGSINPVIDGNTVNHTAAANGGSSLYPKASSGAKYRNNVVNLDGTSFAGYGFHEGADGANLASGTEFTNNIIRATGANATALLWADGTGSSGGATANDNRITLASGAALGNIRGGHIDTQADLQSVWATYNLSGDITTNDSRSTVN